MRRVAIVRSGADRPKKASPMFPIGDSIPHSRRPTIVWWIIGLNVAAFLYQLSLTDQETQIFLYKHALVPRRFFYPSWGTGHGLSPLDLSPFLTNMFLHGGLLHILFNLWTLFIFGPALESRLGHARFLVLYLAAGLIASLTHAFFNASSAVPALGASGAIAGVIAAYARLFPYAWISVVVPIFFIPLIFQVPALMFAGLWFLVQVLQGTSELLVPSFGGGIAWWAHIGGFVAGWLLIKSLTPPRLMRWPPPGEGPWGPLP